MQPAGSAQPASGCAQCCFIHHQPGLGPNSTCLWVCTALHHTPPARPAPALQTTRPHDPHLLGPVCACAQVSKLCDLPPGDTVCSVAWSQRGTYLSVGCNSGKVQVWDAARMRLVRIMEGHR